MKNMDRRARHILLLTIFSVAFYFFGSYMHQPVRISTSIDTELVNSDSRKFYSSFVSGTCPFINTPDTEDCIAGLASSTLAEADMLADKLIKSVPEENADQFVVSYYDGLHANVRSTQKVRDAYFEAVCSLNGLLSYGGTGMNSDIQACRYYYAQLYLNLLKSLDKPIKHLWSPNLCQTLSLTAQLLSKHLAVRT